MKLISDIINDLVDDQLPITVALNKTKILATRIGNRNLLNWVNYELKGYPNRESLPEYRITNGTIIGDFVNGRHQVTNYPIPLPEFGDGMDDQLREFRFLESAATLELFSKNENPSLVFRFPEQLKNSLEDILRNTNGPYFQLLNIGVTIPIHIAAQALSATKDKLLEFMLGIEKEFGVETEISELKSNNAKINYIMNNTITNNGDGNVVNAGANSSISAIINITKGNKEQLVQTLKDSGVENDDVAELLTIIDSEQPVNNGFGIKVNEWMKKMLSKSLDGTWQVGIGAAGTLLAEALKAYYG
ncbi:hypothetical protein EZ428_21285 [Pedobacter frigiditerrae]|uniref:AbiTii domain-containing protein n=1 Tax=Pedobacter frigiditerrae TaxID=2530452 RepID=A0A4R0MM56_9SPHI|nr:hypothetical protein [Pedobacter frigiditerrae]TCC87242.1 hypothetical protein EZ428_21285 [Pedobacter frigiditerrae]